MKLYGVWARFDIHAGREMIP